MVDDKPNADILFESSWEVCNKVGGIYTVVKSKAAIINDYYKEYYMVGPYFENNARIEAEQVVPPDYLKEVFSELENEGIKCFYGKWRCKGEPSVILIDFYSLKHKVAELRKWLWEEYKIESHAAHWDFDEPMLYSYAVGRLIELFAAKKSNKKIVGHFHEWMAGISLLHLKSRGSNVKTIFTTHATMLGRSISGKGRELYYELPNLDPHREAEQIGVLEKFTTEKACASTSDCFTTVSEITSIEAEKILDRKADVLLLNGLDIEKFPTFEECSINHRDFRDKAREFVSYYFLPNQQIDLEDTLFFFIVGRYEYKNKGIDIFIDALGKLNERLKAEGSSKNIITFFWIPSGVGGIQTPLLENRDQYEHISELIAKSVEKRRQKILRGIMSDKDMRNLDLFDADESRDIASFKARLNRNEPLLSTHVLHDEANDPIVNNLRNVGITNKKEDRVKAVFYPVYLNGSDGLLNLKYYDAIQACHLGVFPSYYEPWGYTPLESAALGVPAITTDLAGFGRYIRTKRGNENEKGIFVIDRLDKSYDESCEALANIMYDYTKLRRKDRVEQKMVAKKLAEYADWSKLAKNYIKAHNFALKRK